MLIVGFISGVQQPEAPTEAEDSESVTEPGTYCFFPN